MNLQIKWFGDTPIRYRPESSDEAIITEVIERRSYRKPSIGFDVEKGETWLDLGANIGAFAVYSKIRGAKAICYEPTSDNFPILVRNASGFQCVQSAVTHQHDSSIKFWTRNTVRGRFSAKYIYHRGSMMESISNGDPVMVPNTFIGDLPAVDGIKMDIEGAEGPILDLGIIPWCDKLCLEYHATVDKRTETLGRRLEILKQMFSVVCYTPELDRMVSSGGLQRTFFDRMIWCMGRRK